MEPKVDSKDWTIQLFGEPSATFRGQRATLPSVRRATLLLIRLASSPRRIWSREELCEVLWPDEFVDVARDRLRQTLALLNKSLRDTGGESPIIATKSTLGLDLERVEIDCQLFSSRLRRAAASEQDSLRAETLEEAIGVAHAPFAEGYMDDWVRVIRDSFDNEVHRAKLQLAQLYRDLGNPEKAIPLLNSTTQTRPYDESTTILLVQILAQLGRTSESENVVQHFRSRLLKGLGLQPSQHFLDSVSISSEQATGYGEPISTWIDMARPVTRFFGRESELAWLEATLSESDHRLVTVTGLGGSGKTRLVTEFLTQASGRWREVIAFGLAERSSGSEVVQALASSLKLKNWDEKATIAHIAERIGPGSLLLVLDNCEHLHVEVSSMVGRLLAECPNLQVVATSRILLGLLGEVELPLLPLATPRLNGDSNEQLPAMQMLIERIRIARPSFQITPVDLPVLEQICMALGGIPLAIELVGARARVLSLEQILNRLSSILDFVEAEVPNLPARHRALRSVLSWSFNDLAHERLVAITALSVFQGSWSFEAAEAITGLSDVEYTLDELRSRSLIFTEPLGNEVRFRMLEVVRQYAKECAEPEHVSSALRAHMNYFGEYSKRLVLERAAGEESQTMQRFLVDQPNFRLATLTALEAGTEGTDALVGFTTYLPLFYEVLGFSNEDIRILKLVIEQDRLPVERRSHALNFYCQSLCMRADVSAIREMLPIYQNSYPLLDDLSNQSSALSMMSYMALVANEREFSAWLIEPLSTLIRKNNVIRQSSFLKVNLANSLHHIGESDRAIAVNNEVIELDQPGTDLGYVIDAKLNQARIYRELGQPRTAVFLAIQAVKGLLRLRGFYVCLEGIQELLASLVDCQPSAELQVVGAHLYGYVEEERKRLGAPILPYELAGFRNAELALKLALGSQFDQEVLVGRRFSSEDVLESLEVIESQFFHV